MFSNVAKKFEERFAATKSQDFELMIQADIDLIKSKYLNEKNILIRVHDSGDFYSQDYLMKWLDIMQSNPDINFYAYTKQASMLKRAPHLPNFKVIFSFGGKQDHLIDVTKDRHSLVFETNESLVAECYSNASLNDLVAIGLNHRIGLVFHHAKKFTNTLWSKVSIQQKTNEVL